MKVFRAMTEISACIDRLKDCETYVSRFPFSRTRVTRAAYLQFVVEGHLHEIYLLKERLVKLTKIISRQFKKDKGAGQVARSMEALSKFVVKALDGFTNVRGAHVHQWRYSHKDIDRLQLINTLRKPKGSPFSQSLKSLERIANQDSHGRLRKQTVSWNRALSKFLEEFFKVLNSIVLAPDGKSLIVPGK